jgi:hypothetical protein
MPAVTLPSHGVQQDFVAYIQEWLRNKCNDMTLQKTYQNYSLVLSSIRVYLYKSEYVCVCLSVCLYVCMYVQD